ncbi:hypothetical protein BOX15_Mlig029960g1 [Macrostomum lignano]|uniref:Uncharacterized protein n=2 Tax=Macrostomum lignano TaxID=282301 RepID=A0A267FUK2_9PLAT|nr:hypothetical protein BOX15_Mlig029960g1 [Macrostomum lignano]
MLKLIGKLVILLCFGCLAGYCLLLYLDLRSYAVLKNFELQNKNSILEKYKAYEWNSKNILVFLQLSDIHVSLFRDPARVPDLRQFLANELRLIRPELVVVSGDLTDAKLPDFKASRQYEEEWKIYHGLLQEFKVDEVTKWLDLRGNHDAFNIFSLDARQNFFAKYSRRGKDSPRSYMHTVRKPFGQYSFVALDVVPMPGPKRPYNFFGFLDTTAILDVQRLARKARTSNHSFWFGHYPLSIIVSQGFDLHSFLGRHAYSYMCGHLHTLGGSVPNMYGLHPEGFLELELGDWMDNRLYRIVAIDNDVVSFRDLRLGTWPAVHVTSPKDARYLLPHKEPAAWLNRSLEIRVLAFSPDAIAFVKVWLDGGYLGNATPQPGVGVAGLYSLPWQPGAHAGDRHRLEVRVRDAIGREAYVEQEFSMTGQPNWRFGRLQNLILLGDVTKFVRLVFYTTWLALFAPLIGIRVARYRFADSLVQSMCSWFHPEITRGLYRFVLSDGLFYPWIVYFLYMGCGPLMMGYFVDDSFGVMFLSGLYIGGTWLPESLIYVSEFIQLCAFHLPLLALLCYRLGRQVDRTPPAMATRWQRLACILDSRSWIYPLLAWQLWLSVNFLLATYDLTVFLLSPCRLWQVGFGWYLHRTVCRNEAAMLAHSGSQH